MYIITKADNENRTRLSNLGNWRTNQCTISANKTVKALISNRPYFNCAVS